MKKNLVLMAMAGVALAGCVNEEVTEVSQKEQQKTIIGFDKPVLYNNSESRAVVYGEIGSHTYDGSTTTYSYPREEKFQIYAVEYPENTSLTSWGTNTVTSDFNDTAIEWQGIGIDGWAPKDGTNYYYWPASKKMAFAACSPADLELTQKSATNPDGVQRTYGTTGLQIKNFSVPVRADGNHYDLLYSERIIDQKAGNMNHSASYYSGIPIKFQHALSSIRFSLMNKTLATVCLTKIELWGVYSKADFDEGIDENNTNFTDGGKWKYTRATYNYTTSQYNNDGNVKPVWKNWSEQIAEANPYVGFEGNINFPYPNANYVSSITALENEGGEDNKSHQLLLLPQELGSDAKLRVYYTVGSQSAHKDISLNLQQAYSTPDSPDSATKVTISKWGIGKRYTYRLVYSDATQQQDMIYFAPSTEGWQEENIIVVNL